MEGCSSGLLSGGDHQPDSVSIVVSGEHSSWCPLYVES